MDMVERVARAMRGKYNADFLSGVELRPFEESSARDAWVACAIAAIEALREPTDDVLRADAGTSTTDSKRWKAALWQAQIDSILKSTRETA
jgi:hypothetical protein